MAKGTCHNCKERFEVAELTLAIRKVGGSYNRAGSKRKCMICESCARRLLSQLQPGQLSASQWGKSGLELAVDHFDRSKILASQEVV